MTDIVERARARFPRPKHADDGLIVRELCDEIERLRETLNHHQQSQDWPAMLAKLKRAEAVIEAARNYVRCSKDPNLSPYIKENGLTSAASPWAELCNALAAYDKERSDD